MPRIANFRLCLPQWFKAMQSTETLVRLCSEMFISGILNRTWLHMGQNVDELQRM